MYKTASIMLVIMLKSGRLSDIFRHKLLHIYKGGRQKQTLCRRGCDYLCLRVVFFNNISHCADNR